MNRIVLIGNGFDLAHGLKTSYKNFIDWYWKDWGGETLVVSEWEGVIKCSIGVVLE